MTFHLAAQFFPLVIAPGIVAYIRRRWPSLVTSGAIDGLLDWLAVVIAAVLFSLLIDFAFAVPLTIDAFRRGVLLGLTSATGHTLATGKGRPMLPDRPTPLTGTPVDPDVTRVAPSPWPKSGVHAQPELSWGSSPTVGDQ